MKKLIIPFAVLMLALGACTSGKTQSAASGESADTAAVADKYLFAYFTGNDKADETIHFALSDDGFTWRALNGNMPVISSDTISETGGVRDPHIIRRHDGKGFYMVATDMVSANGWDSNRGFVMLKSDNLKDWTHSVVNIQKTYPNQDNLLRVWAPQTIYDPAADKYMIYWSMQHGADNPDIIYYAYANDDFTGIEGEPKQLFFPADGNSCIDGDIVRKGDKYYMFYKTEGHGNGIKLATTDSLTSGRWDEQPDYKQLTKEAVEGAGVFPLAGTDDYILMYDVYMKGGYEFARTSDLSTFRPVEDTIDMDFHPRHGSVVLITEKEAADLRNEFKAAE